MIAIFSPSGGEISQRVGLLIQLVTQGATSLARYQAMSKTADANVAPAGVFGGILRNVVGGSAGRQVTRVATAPQ